MCVALTAPLHIVHSMIHLYMVLSCLYAMPQTESDVMNGPVVLAQGWTHALHDLLCVPKIETLKFLLPLAMIMFHPPERIVVMFTSYCIMALNCRPGCCGYVTLCTIF